MRVQQKYNILLIFVVVVSIAIGIYGFFFREPTIIKDDSVKAIKLENERLKLEVDSIIDYHTVFVDSINVIDSIYVTKIDSLTQLSKNLSKEKDWLKYKMKQLREEYESVDIVLPSPD